MNILMLVLQMLLQVVAYPEAPCELKGPTHYDIFSTIVKIQIYYCYFYVRDDIKCEDKYAQTVVNLTIDNYCITKRNSNLHPHSGRILDASSVQEKVAVCKSVAQANLLEDRVVLSGNRKCQYSKGYCDYQNDYVVWFPNECQDRRYIFNGFFDVYTVKDKKYIRHESASLQITENVDLCNQQMSKTNHEGVVVIPSDYKNLTQPDVFLPNYKSTLDSVCKVTTKNDFTKSWYIYNYEINITVYHCHFDENSSCVMPNNDILNRCKTFCSTAACEDVKVCEKSLKVDLKEDIVKGLSSACKYSDGECPKSKAFWYNSVSCGDIKKSKGSYIGNCNGTNCVIKDSNSKKLILTGEGELCGENIWFTDKDGIVASEKELQFVSTTAAGVSKKLYSAAEDFDGIRMVVIEQRRNINDLKALLNYLLFFLLVCVLWYILSVIVNCSSLRTVGKTRASKNKTYLMNCVSQSLTNRYVFLGSKESEKNGPVVMSKLQESELYESIEDRL
ncbi:uncharacterized protein LOC108913725 [Anoplophora glabripennis]|uniref:uncharacterized protein LOC108913725 n=1 Tax=Anoplophora glabripennis TaxID=217634 RepID=UPI00087525E5|nr:uncharacterized protein LOC108913725 [Anoplophora glabripennis]